MNKHYVSLLLLLCILAGAVAMPGNAAGSPTEKASLITGSGGVGQASEDPLAETGSPVPGQPTDFVYLPILSRSMGALQIFGAEHYALTDPQGQKDG